MKQYRVIYEYLEGASKEIIVEASNKLESLVVAKNLLKDEPYNINFLMSYDIEEEAL